MTLLRGEEGVFSDPTWPLLADGGMGGVRGAGPEVTWSAPGWSPDSPRERCWPSGRSAGAGPACWGTLSGTRPWTWSATASAASSSSRGGFWKELGFRHRPFPSQPHTPRAPTPQGLPTHPSALSVQTPEEAHLLPARTATCADSRIRNKHRSSESRARSPPGPVRARHVTWGQHPPPTSDPARRSHSLTLPSPQPPPPGRTRKETRSQGHRALPGLPPPRDHHLPPRSPTPTPFCAASAQRPGNMPVRAPAAVQHPGHHRRPPGLRVALPQSSALSRVWLPPCTAPPPAARQRPVTCPRPPASHPQGWRCSWAQAGCGHRQGQDHAESGDGPDRRGTCTQARR